MKAKINRKRQWKWISALLTVQTKALFSSEFISTLISSDSLCNIYNPEIDKIWKKRRKYKNENELQGKLQLQKKRQQRKSPTRRWKKCNPESEKIDTIELCPENRLVTLDPSLSK